MASQSNTDDPCEYYFEEDKPYDISILFIGATGAGKSTLCNFLVKKPVFKAEACMESVTQAASSYYFNFSNKTYKVIDCPGFMDNEEKNQERILSEICRSAVLARYGLDAIVFVINPAERFTDNRHEQALYILQSLGNTFWNYSFIIFTHEESMKRENCPTSKSYLQSYIDNPDCSKVFLKIFTEVDRRHMMIESVSSGFSHNNEYWEIKLTEMTKHISVLNKNMKSIRFNCVLMEQGKELYEKHFGLLMKKKEIQKKLNVLIPMFETLKSQKDQRNENLKKHVFQLQVEINEDEKKCTKIDNELSSIGNKIRKIDDKSKKDDRNENLKEHVVQLQAEVKKDEEKCKKIENELSAVRNEIRKIDDTMKDDVNTYENNGISGFFPLISFTSAALILGLIALKFIK